jgi:nucleotide-binding universal stress UspA family protein
MERILYATDFSENSERALPHAWQIAMAHDAELVMLHVMEIPTLWQHPDKAEPLEMEKDVVKDAERRLKEMFKRHADHGKVTFVLVEGISVTKTILSETKARCAELVIVGTRGESRLKESLMGSTTMTLIRKCPVPVLAVPEGSTSKTFKKVLYASDFNKEDPEAIERLAALSAPLGSKISIVHIAVPGEQETELSKDELFDLIKKRLPDTQFDLEVRLSQDLPGTLDEFVRMGGFDMLAMLEKERVSLLDRLFHRDLVKRMEFHARLPILCFNAR